jgi:hypothetical protein
MVTRALLALLVAGTLAACGGGGGDDDDQVATLGEDNAAADDDSSSADDGDGELTEAEREDAMLEFTECMRDHGVDMPDPSSAGGGGGGDVIISPAPGAGANGDSGGNGPRMDEEFEAANEACEGILDDAFGDRPQLSPEEQAEMQDNMLAFTECMREHGIDMPDPEFSEDGGGFSVRVDDEGGGGGGPDPSDPDFEAAQEACQGELGFEGEGGPVMRTEGGPRGGSS